MPRVSELWVFPIKSCQGTQVKSVEVTPAGFALDRVWCVVDAGGARYPAGEYLSQRKMRCLATVGVEIRGDDLLVTAPGMPALSVPIDERAVADNAEVPVVCGGISTTDPEGSSWVLGRVNAKSAGSEAEAWFTEYLNKADVDKQSRPRARYILARMPKKERRKVAEYAGPTATTRFEGIPGAACKEFQGVREKDGAAFHDFAPFLMTSASSLRHLNELMGTKGYPMVPFRGSIVVDGCNPWEEESWAEFRAGGFDFNYIKECPRCSIPTRDQVCAIC